MENKKTIEYKELIDYLYAELIDTIDDVIDVENRLEALQNLVSDVWSDVWSEEDFDAWSDEDDEASKIEVQA